MAENKEKVVLAYSGGLDTSVIIPWIIENYNYEVIAVCCNAGQKDDFEAIKQKTLNTEAYKVDILVVAIGKAKFVTADFVKQGAIIIDVGINRDEATGKLCGNRHTEVSQ